MWNPDKVLVVQPKQHTGYDAENQPTGTPIPGFFAVIASHDMTTELADYVDVIGPDRLSKVQGGTGMENGYMGVQCTQLAFADEAVAEGTEEAPGPLRFGWMPTPEVDPWG